MNGNLGGRYALGADIDARVTSGWNGEAGFLPVGDSSGAPFTGKFNGLGHTVTGLTIRRNTTDSVGLFGVTSAADIRNVDLRDSSISGRNSTGGLIGTTYSGSRLSNSHFTGTVSGADSTGGLVGYHFSGTVSNSYAAGSVAGTSNTGALVGLVSEGVLSNNTYSVEGLTINGTTGVVSPGGLYQTQWNDWLGNNRALKPIGEYFPPVADGYYTIGTASELKNLLGFASSNSGLKFRLSSHLDFSTPEFSGLAGKFYLPEFRNTELDGATFVVRNFSLNRTGAAETGFIGRLDGRSYRAPVERRCERQLRHRCSDRHVLCWRLGGIPSLWHRQQQSRLGQRLGRFRYRWAGGQFLRRHDQQQFRQRQRYGCLLLLLLLSLHRRAGRQLVRRHDQ